MGVVKEIREPGHGVVRIFDDCIQPPEVRAQLLKELAEISYRIELRWFQEQQAEKQKTE